MIPKIIHLIFLRKSKTDEIPAILYFCKKKIEEMHPLWDIILWDEDSAIKFISNRLPEYLTTYNSFKYNIQRADFLRLCLLYTIGGFYMDIDMYPIKSLDDILDNSLLLGIEKIISKEEQKIYNLKYCKRIANYMIGSIPNHQFIKLLITNMKERACIDIKTHQQILDITGPGLVTDIYWNNVDKYLDIILLNIPKHTIVVNNINPPAYFGEYAIHLQAGSWRNEI